jgi:hypothetical protein
VISFALPFDYANFFRNDKVWKNVWHYEKTKIIVWQPHMLAKERYVEWLEKLWRTFNVIARLT